MKVLEKKIIVDYSNTIFNTIAVEKLFYKYYEFEADNFYYLPRPDKWITKIKKHQKKIRPFLVFFSYIYRYGFAYFYFFIQFIYSLSFLIKRKQFHKWNSEIVLAFSNLSLKLIKNDQLKLKPHEVIVFPWIDYHKIPDNSINFKDLIKYNDLVKSFILAVQVLNTKRLSSPQYIFQTYTAFYWFLVRIGIDRLSSNLIITNHTDRWAVLADQSILANSKKGIKLNFTIVQHGKVDFTDGEKKTSYRLKYKLNSVTKLFCYDEDSKDFFYQQIFSAGRCSEIDVLFFKPLIKLTEINDDSFFRVLFIGHPLCQETQINIFHTLSEYDNALFYYKPHPTVKPSNLIKKESWNLINSKDFFPNVDLVISYDSTLALEYKNLGKTVIYHQNDSKDIRSIIDKISIINKIYFLWSKNKKLV